MTSLRGRRRILMAVTGAVFGATLAYGSVSYAQAPPSTTKPAPTAPSPVRDRAAAPAKVAPILPKVHNAVDTLVAQGVITQAQGEAVLSQADAGSIDPSSLTPALTPAQLHRVVNAIDQVKQSYRP